MRLDRTGWRVRVASAALLSTSACTAFGERLYSGECPDGETCSHEAPGAKFVGEPVAGDEIRLLDTSWNPTAVGGTQAIEIEFPRGQSAPYQPKTTDPGVFSVDWSADGKLVLHGQGEGEAYLRLVEPNTDVLIDRKKTKVAPIARASLIPADLALAGATGDDHFALFAGSPCVFGLDPAPPEHSACLAVVLLSPSGESLVDDGTTVLVPDGFAQHDRRYVVGPADATGPLAFEVHAGGHTFASQVDVVTEVDDIVLGCPGPYAWASSLVMKVGETREVCFRALRAGASVGGASWQFESTPHVEVGQFLPNVAMLDGKAPGKGSLAVTVAGVTRSFPYEVTP
jgi:hypothetical protein